MSRHLMRSLRYLAALSYPADRFVDEECMRKGTPDELELSVYEVDDHEVVRARAEHQASNTQRPEKKDLAAVMLTGFSDITMNDKQGRSIFDFTRVRHKNLEFLDREEMISVVAQALPETSRHRKCSADDIRAYVRSRFEQRDPEWIAMADEAKRDKWRKFCGAPADPQLRLGEVVGNDAVTELHAPMQASEQDPAPVPTPPPTSPDDASS